MQKPTEAISSHQQSDTAPEQVEKTATEQDEPSFEATHKSETGSTPEALSFETGNPETAAVSSGVLHLADVSGRLDIVAVESVPGLMTSPDFCIFIRPFADKIVHFRPLRLKTERNRYIVVMQFKEAKDATNFAQVYGGKHFLQGLVQETCEIRQVTSISFDTLDNADAAGFPTFEMFPSENEDALHGTCAVCLERLDAREAALITTFCNHTMHAACLSQWDLNICPVCRHTHELTPEASVCMVCNQREDLWMCVVCAFVGCGVYKNKHAHAHFNETQHPFSINLEECTFWSGEKLRAGSVWDYSSERFVNRLLSSDDGKVVEVARDPSTANGAGSSTAADAACCQSGNVGIVDDEEDDRALQAAVYASRMDAMVDEYRARIERMEAEHAAEQNRLEEAVRQLRETVDNAAKEKRSLQRRANETEKKARGLLEKNGFLKNLSEALLKDNRGWNDEVERLKKELAEAAETKSGLVEQIRDLMMHVEAQAKIGSESCRSGPSELHGADVLRVGPSPRERLAMKTNRR